MDDLHKCTEEVSGRKPGTSPTQGSFDGAVSECAKTGSGSGAATEFSGEREQPILRWGVARDSIKRLMPTPDPLVEKAKSDWSFLSDPDNLSALADIDQRSAREELIREWDRDVSRALRRERGILDMGARFIDFMENEASTAETAEELMRGADATLGYMIHDVRRLAEKRERLTKQLRELNEKVPPVAADALLRRLGAADPAESIRKYKAAGRTRAAARQQEAQAALSAVVQVNASAAAHVKSALKREGSRRPLALESTEAERIFPVLRALLDEKRLNELKNGSLPPAALRDSLSAWAGEIEEKLIKANHNGRDLGV